MPVNNVSSTMSLDANKPSLLSSPATQRPSTPTTHDLEKHSELGTSFTSDTLESVSPRSPSFSSSFSGRDSPDSLDNKRKWNDSFTFAERQEASSNISKASHTENGYEDTSSLYSQDDRSQDSDDSQLGSRRPGRKPMAEESADEDEDPKAKRKVQNRAAQRAFRERKERYVKDLETKIKQVQDNHLFATTQLFQENQYLRSVIYRLETENFALKGMQINMP
ncbi:basic-leucine zipper transcription factor, partial [Phycomyces blakesleeanus NRRL 1555(-)]